MKIHDFDRRRKQVAARKQNITWLLQAMITTYPHRVVDGGRKAMHDLVKETLLY